MRIVVAECSVLYSGRGDTTMGRAVRSIMIKEDGAVGIHNDVGNKPLNYMGKGNVFTETIDEEAGTTVWRFDTRKEYIQITLYAILTDFQTELDDGSVPIVRDGTESDLQAFLFEHPELIETGLIPLQREYQTSAGPIDLMFVNDSGMIGVEVKRVAMLGAIDQCVRYRKALTEQHPDTDIKVYLVALDVRPNTMKLAEKRSIPYFIVPEEWKNLRKENGKFEAMESQSESLAGIDEEETSLF